MQSSAPNVDLCATQDGHKTPRLIHPHQVLDRLESKGADAILRYRGRRRRTSAPELQTKDGHNLPRLIRRCQVPDRLEESEGADPPKVTASVLGEVVPRNVSVQLKHDGLTSLIRTHQSDHTVRPFIEHHLNMKSSKWKKHAARVKHDARVGHDLLRPFRGKDPLSPDMEYLVGSTAPSPRKVYVHLKHKNLDSLIRAHIASTSLPPATEYPPTTTALARRKIFAHLKQNTLAPLIRKYMLDHLPSATEYPPGKTYIVSRKDFAQLVYDNLAPVRTHKSENPFLPPQSESMGVVGKPRIRTVVDGRPVALPNLQEEVKVRRIFFSNGTIPRKEISILKDLGENEPTTDELTSWLDGLHALVSERVVLDTPDITTETGISPSSPHYTPQYSARPPASSWNPTSTRQSLEYSKMSFSTWSSKAAKRQYATAAVSNN